MAKSRRRPPNRLLTDAFREIKNTRSRFISLMVLSALAVCFLAGLRATAPDMKLSADRYFDQQNLMDLRVVSTLALTDKDVEALAAEEGVACAEGAYTVDAILPSADNDYIVKVHSITDQVNLPRLQEGRMPERPDEILVEPLFLKESGLKVGDRVSLDTGTGDFEDALRCKEFTIVGTADSPLYISIDRGSSSLGTGRVIAFVLAPQEAFDMEFFTDAYLLMDGARELETYSDEYEDLMDQRVEQLEELADQRAPMRKQEVLDEANETLADAQQELDDAKAEAEQELADGKAELDDARKELDDGWAEYRDGVQEYEDGQQELKDKVADAQQEIADAEQELADALVELQDGETELKDGWAEYDENYIKYTDGINEYRDGLAQYRDGEAQYDSGWAAYKDGLHEYQQGKKALAEAREELNRGQAQYEQGRAQLDQLLVTIIEAGGLDMTPEQLYQGLASGDPAAVAAADAVLAGMHAQLDDGLAQANAKREELETQRAQLQEALDTLPPMIEELETQLEDPETSELEKLVLQMKLDACREQLTQAQEALPQLEAGLEQVDQTIAELEAQKAQLPADAAQLCASAQLLEQSRLQLEEGFRQLDANAALLRDARRELDHAEDELDDARAELEEAKAELDDAKAELDDAAAKLDEGKADLEQARVDLDDGWKEYNDGLAELDDARVTLKDEVADAEAELADAKVQLADALADLNQGEADYADGVVKYEDGKKEAEEKIRDAEDEIAKARRDIDAIEDCEWYLLDRNTNMGYLSYSMDADRMGNLASVFPLIFFLVAALVCLTTMTRMVEEQRVAIGGLKALGYSRGSIAIKYVGYGFLASTIGSLAGLAIGLTLLPWIICTAWSIMYTTGDIFYSLEPATSVLACLAAIGTVTLSAWGACFNALSAVPAQLMRPKAPPMGKRILLERVTPLWKRLSFNYKITLRNLFRYKRRFWMTVVGIGGCAALIVTAFGLRDSILDVMDKQYDELYTHTAHIGLVDKVTPGEVREVGEVLDDSGIVAAWTPCRNELVTAQTDAYTMDAYLQVTEDNDTLSRFVSLRHRTDDAEVTMPDDGVVLTEKLAHLLEVGAGDTFILDGSDGRVEVRVADVTENYIQHYIYMSRAFYETLFGQSPEDNLILVDYPVEDDRASGLAADIVALDGVTALSLISDTRRTFTSSLESVDYAVILVIVCAAALAFVVLYNLTNINITERMRELATLKVLGFYDPELSAYVYRENVILTFFGVALGMLMGKLLHHWLILTVEIDMLMFGRTLEPTSYGWSIVLTVIFSLVVNLAAHWKLKKLDMVESLKTVE